MTTANQTHISSRPGQVFHGIRFKRVHLSINHNSLFKKKRFDGQRKKRFIPHLKAGDFSLRRVKKQWRRWSKGQGITALFAHPYYPQDKGKVERTIRNIAEEFVHLLRKFPGWLEGKIREYREGYNTERFHRDISCRPIQLY